MSKYSLLGKEPIFQPQVASFAQGMVVSVPLHYSFLKPGTTGKDLYDTLLDHYENSAFVEVMPFGNTDIMEAGLLERGAFLRPDTLADTNKLHIFVFDNADIGQYIICARLDNVGKGASGAAVQNMNIALGFNEDASL